MRYLDYLLSLWLILVDLSPASQDFKMCRADWPHPFTGNEYDYLPLVRGDSDLLGQGFNPPL